MGRRVWKFDSGDKVQSGWVPPDGDWFIAGFFRADASDAHLFGIDNTGVNFGLSLDPGSFTFKFGGATNGVTAWVGFGSHTLGEVTHFALSWDNTAGELTAYINGALVGTQAISAPLVWTADVLIGIRNTSGHKPFTGMQWDFKAGEKTLTAAEAQWLYDGTGDDPGAIVVHFAAKEESGVVADNTGTGADGVITAADADEFHWQLTAEIPRVVYKFEEGDYVDSNYTPTGDYSVSVFCLVSDTQNRALLGIVSTHSGYGALAFNGDLLFMMSDSANLGSAQSPDPTKVDHFVFSWDDTSGEVTVYRDGLLIGTYPITTPVAWPDEIAFGVRAAGSGIEPFEGLMWGMQVYDKQLSAAEVQYIYDGSGSDPGTPVVRFEANERSGTTAVNSGSGSDGVITAADIDAFHHVVPSGGAPVRDIRICRNTNLARGLAGWWPVGNSRCWRSSTLLDVSGRNGHGALTNMPRERFTQVEVRPCVDFVGGSEHVIVTRNPTLISSRGSVSLWARVEGDLQQDFLSLSGAADWLIFYFSNRIWFRGNWTQFEHTVTPTDAHKSWQHYAMTWTSDALDGYVNGVRVAGGAFTAGGTVGNLLFGGGAGSHLIGQLDDIRLYTRTLSATEISQTYNETRFGYGSLSRENLRDRLAV